MTFTDLKVKMLDLKNHDLMDLRAEKRDKLAVL